MKTPKTIASNFAELKAAMQEEVMTAKAKADELWVKNELKIIYQKMNGQESLSAKLEKLSAYEAEIEAAYNKGDISQEFKNKIQTKVNAIY